jgi:hypothetical protein
LHQLFSFSATDPRNKQHIARIVGDTHPHAGGISGAGGHTESERSQKMTHSLHAKKQPEAGAGTPSQNPRPISLLPVKSFASRRPPDLPPRRFYARRWNTPALRRA